MQSAPLEQPLVWMKAHGLQLPSPWFAEPKLAKAAGGRLGISFGSSGVSSMMSAKPKRKESGKVGEWAGGGGTECTAGIKI